MRKPQSLYRRGAVYYWRRIIPARHVASEASVEVRLSLKTTNYAAAVAGARRLSAVADQLLEGTRKTMDAGKLSSQQWRDLVRDFIREELDQMEMLRAGQAALRPDEVEASSQTWTMMADAHRAMLASNELEPIAQHAYSFITGKGVEIDPDSDRFRQFQRDILRALVQVDRINAERARGYYREDEAPLPLEAAWSTAPREAFGPQPAPGTVASAPTGDQPGSDSLDPTAEALHMEEFHQRFAGIAEPADNSTSSLTPNSLLSEAFAALKKAKEEDSRWVGETERRTRNSIELIIEILKDRPLKSYTRDQVKKAREVMEKVPASHGKSASRKLSIDRAIREADKMQKAQIAKVEQGIAEGKIDPDNLESEMAKAMVKRLEKKTINHHLANVGQIFKFARDELRLKVENPFFKTRFDTRVVEQSSTRKVRVLDDDDMEKLFRSPIFTGFRSPKRRWLPGKLWIQDDLYWVLLLEAFQGVRLEEACQLKCADVRTFSDVQWLLIHGLGENSTKTTASNRAVPLHRFLIQLGFLEHVENMRKAGKHRLFPNLRRNSRGKLGASLTKRYKSYRDKIGLGGLGKDGHALRHAFDTYLHNENVPTIRLSELMGHEREGMTAGTYFKGSHPWLLWEAINRLTYGFKVETIDGVPQLVRDRNSGWTIPGKVAAAAAWRDERDSRADIIDVTPSLLERSSGEQPGRVKPADAEG